MVCTKTATPRSVTHRTELSLEIQNKYNQDAEALLRITEMGDGTWLYEHDSKDKTEVRNDCGEMEVAQSKQQHTG